MKKKTKKKPLTKKQKLAVSIAKDALKQFVLKTYNAHSGTLVSVPGLNDLLTKVYGDGSVSIPKGGVELQPFLKKALRNGSTCDVCIRGGLLLSTVVKHNKFKTKLIKEEVCNSKIDEDVSVFQPRWTSNFIAIYNPNDIVDIRLSKIFSARTLALAERVFEGDFNLKQLSIDDAQAAKNWFGWLDSDQSRAIAILESIIKNKGELIIPKEFYEID